MLPKAFAPNVESAQIFGLGPKAREHRRGFLAQPACKAVLLFPSRGYKARVIVGDGIAQLSPGGPVRLDQIKDRVCARPGQ
jgi:hypothetical protein